MKCLLLAIFTTAAATAGAQEVNPELKKKLDEYLQKRAPNAIPNPQLKSLAPGLGINAGQNRKPGVYALPQDGMPCIVPDTNDIVQIPNALPKKDLPKLGQIPNVTPQTGEELRKNQRQFFAPPGR